LVHLAFWAKNMTVLRDAGMQWPGFSYAQPEWARMEELAAAVDDGALAKFKVVTAIVFIALAAAGIVLVFLPVESLLFPHPAETPAVYFVLLLAAACFLIIGAGLPLAMRAAALASANEQTRQRLTPAPGDGALAHKVAYQINRIAAVICGLFVPGTLLWIAFNIRGGPIIVVLKWLSFAAIAAAIVYARVARPRQGPS
jgi:hypothetical protein